MHVYIYDSFVNQKKYDSTMARIETRITDLGLNGKIFRLGMMNSVAEIVENEIKKGAKTIVAVGNDILLNKIISSTARLSSLNLLNKNVPIGFIPVGNENNMIAQLLGINLAENACNVLSARRIERASLGKANNNYFLTKAVISTKGTILEIDDNFSIENNEIGEISIINLPKPTAKKENNKVLKSDFLRLLIKNKKNNKLIPIRPILSNESFFPFNKLKIINKKYPVTIDGSINIDSPVEISLAKEKISLIVGKERSF